MIETERVLKIKLRKAREDIAILRSKLLDIEKIIKTSDLTYIVKDFNK